jgi:23S rRNA (cytidine2498-2'-O)-methyltransferase
LPVPFGPAIWWNEGVDRHVFLCAPGYEDPLRREIGTGAEALCSGVVLGGGADRLLADEDHVFARQVLPAARSLRAPSVRQLAAGAFDALLPGLDASGATWRLEALVPDEPADPHRPGELRRRADLIAAAFLDIAKERRRRVFRRLAPEGGGDLLVQLLLAGRERLFASAAAPAPLPRGGRWPVPFPGGLAPIPEDPAAPSSACRKLREALAWMGRTIREGERVTDLGAAPGGWTHVSLAAGARVTAMDRAGPGPAVAGHPRLTWLVGDAFRHEPVDPPVDWLLCDVIAYPEKSLGLLRRWVESGWCRRLVFHLKFKGREDHGPAFEARELLRNSRFGFVRAKHLGYDRNEVTLMAMEEA